MSASDIDKGSRWSTDIGAHLEKAQYGLICLTQDNLEAPWLLFEAGALSKSIENSRVVPYLHGIEETQLQWPLAQFQAALSDKNSTLKVVKSINEASGQDGLESERLERSFDTWWPQLEATFENIPKTTENAPPPRPESDILEEILSLCRQMSRRITFNDRYDLRSARDRLAHGSLSEHGDSSEGLETVSRQRGIRRVQRPSERNFSQGRIQTHNQLLNERRRAERDARTASDVNQDSKNRENPM